MLATLVINPAKRAIFAFGRGGNAAICGLGRLMLRVLLPESNPGPPETASKIRSGHPESGVEGNPETGCPQDPGPGLGGNLSVGLFRAKSSPFCMKIPASWEGSHQ